MSISAYQTKIIENIMKHKRNKNSVISSMKEAIEEVEVINEDISGGANIGSIANNILDGGDVKRPEEVISEIFNSKPNEDVIIEIFGASSLDGGNAENSTRELEDEDFVDHGSTSDDEDIDEDSDEDIDDDITDFMRTFRIRNSKPTIIDSHPFVV